MKKLLTMMLMLVAGTAMSFSAKTIYLDAKNWANDGAKFAVYTWGGTTEWVEFIAVTGETNIYKAEISDGTTGMILGRFNPDATTYQFNGDGYDYLWNRAGDITEGIADGNMFTPAEGNNSWTYSTPAKPTNVLVAGVRDITKGYQEWNSNTVGEQVSQNMMASSSDFTYTMSVTGRALQAGTYGFKVVKDGSWYPGDNYELVIAETGIYTIDYVFGALTNTVTATATKTADATVENKYYVYEYTSDYSSIGKMETVTTGENAGKFAALTISRAFDAVSTVKFKVVIKQEVNGTPNDDYTLWISNDDTTIDANYNFGFTPAKASTYDITFNIWYSNNNVWTDAAEQLTGYYLISNEGAEDAWIQGSAMTESLGEYSITFSKPGKLFAIAPNTALAADGTVADWSKVVRPVTLGSDWEVNYFVNYSGDTQSVTSGGKVWSVPAGNASNLTLSYDPADNKFYISTDAYETVTIGTTGYATYSNAAAYKVIGTEAEVYIVTAASTAATLTKLATEAEIPAGTGVIIKGDAGSYTIEPSDGSAVVTGNMLIGSGNNTYDITGNYPGGGSYTGYILAKGTKGVGFYKLDPTYKTLAAHKAFLAVPSGLAPEFIAFGGDATGIEAVEKAESMKNAEFYNLAGQRVTQPTKGLYIVNGKKVIVK